MHKDDTIEAVLAVMGEVPKPPPKGKEQKLARIKVGTDESFYLLATYCFDLQRKLLYLCKVAYPFAKYLPEELGEEIRDDTKLIDKAPTWKDRAEIAEDIMLRLYGEIESRAPIEGRPPKVRR